MTSVAPKQTTSHLRNSLEPRARWPAATVEERITVFRTDAGDYLRDTASGTRYFQVYNEAEAIGYVHLFQSENTLTWVSFYPFGNPLSQGVFHEELQGHGIGTYVHAHIVDDLYRAHSSPPACEVWHQSALPARKTHLAAMGLASGSFAELPLVVPLPRYHERSVWYAESRGFTPSRWKPIEDCRSQRE
jgi:hypothetical protein